MLLPETKSTSLDDDGQQENEEPELKHGDKANGTGFDNYSYKDDDNITTRF